MSLQCLVNQVLNMHKNNETQTKKPAAEGSAQLEYARAIVSGALTYRGAACHRCNSSERYTKTRACVNCESSGGVCKSEKTIANENKAKAKASGAATYIGRPCRVCGGTKRCTSNSDCFACKRRKAKK